MVKISGLNPADHYDVNFTIVSEDSCKYEFIHGQWKKECVSKEQQNVERHNVDAKKIRLILVDSG